STDDAENVLNDMAEWAEQFFSIEHSSNRISRKMFVSHLSFYSEVPFDLINQKLRRLVSRLNDVTSFYAKEPRKFNLFGISFKDDPPSRFGEQAFQIERLAGTPFWENKYFSSAPIPTGEHLALLAEFESILKQ